MFETRVHCTSNGFQAAREAGAEEVAPGAPGGAGGSGGTRFAYSCFSLFISTKQQFLQLKKDDFGNEFNFRAFQGGGFKLGSDTVASAAVSA